MYCKVQHKIGKYLANTYGRDCFEKYRVGTKKAYLAPSRIRVQKPYLFYHRIIVRYITETVPTPGLFLNEYWYGT